MTRKQKGEGHLRDIQMLGENLNRRTQREGAKKPLRSIEDFKADRDAGIVEDTGEEEGDWAKEAFKARAASKDVAHARKARPGAAKARKPAGRARRGEMIGVPPGLFEMLQAEGYDPEHLEHLRGSGFFGDLWSGVKNQFTDPNSTLHSTILPIAQLLPYVGPIAKAARVGSVVGKVANAASRGAQALGRAANTIPGVGRAAVGQAARNAAANTATASRVGSVYDAVSRAQQGSFALPNRTNPALSPEGMRQTAAAAAQMARNTNNPGLGAQTQRASMSPFGQYENNATRALGLGPEAARMSNAGQMYRNPGTPGPNATPGYVPPVGRGHFGCGKNGKEKKWLQKVVADMNKGAFTKQAKRAGMDVEDFADEVLKNPDAHTLTTRRRAQFLVNIRREGKGRKRGGGAPDATDWGRWMLKYARGEGAPDAPDDEDYDFNMPLAQWVEENWKDVLKKAKAHFKASDDDIYRAIDSWYTCAAGSDIYFPFIGEWLEKNKTEGEGKKRGGGMPDAINDPIHIHQHMGQRLFDIMRGNAVRYAQRVGYAPRPINEKDVDRLMRSGQHLDSSEWWGALKTYLEYLDKYHRR